MRTTLTIDDDVAALLKQLHDERRAGLKQLVNEALRRGLNDMTKKPSRRSTFRTRSVDCGRLLIDNVDNIAEVLAEIEGEDFR